MDRDDLTFGDAIGQMKIVALHLKIDMEAGRYLDGDITRLQMMDEVALFATALRTADNETAIEMYKSVCRIGEGDELWD